MTLGIQQFQHLARQRLSNEDAALEIELMLCQVLKKSRIFLRTWPDTLLTEAQVTQLDAYLQQREQGVPLAYILGERAFWTLNLSVSPEVLIPRPDTECVVEKVLALAQGKQWRVADLGTGSGAIALSLAKEHPEWSIVATDLYPQSLAIAKHNAQKNQIRHVEFVQGSWFEPLTGLFDCIVSNPPYIVANDPHLAQLRHEPQRALVADKEGLSDLAHLVQHAADYVVQGGWLVLEHGFDQGAVVRQLMQAAGWIHTMTGQDYGGNDRYTVGQRC
ncbi:peptide chain release factor N(5)-glutamine methyltransferase [Agitococcus lubricus]|uniref:Release factor glutamine methyltransferase n=1 Tax=Agitococcus lubricus TaxID=1077255 RepID=A0A2T5ITN3_9GAMM|nr:peptide chain release factor N(5)-glutamine methyltransferase [Agitococcus lubricus]PTQ87224.1 [protein release factor]-glutamine N5-methyltransferase [Agitococcus lubricus]